MKLEFKTPKMQSRTSTPGQTCSNILRVDNLGATEAMHVVMSLYIFARALHYSLRKRLARS